jgi:hypothetical protein
MKITSRGVSSPKNDILLILAFYGPQGDPVIWIESRWCEKHERLVQMVFKNLKETWDLDVFFPGGSESPEFAKYLDALDRDTKALSAEVSGAKISGVESWVARLSKIQQLSNRFRQARAFCLVPRRPERPRQAIQGGRRKGPPDASRIRFYPDHE